MGIVWRMTNAIVPEIPELLATGPHADGVDDLQLYGQFVGSWDLEVTWFEKDGTTRRLPGEWHFGWILGGRAVADVWMVPSRPELDAGAALVGHGVTVRIREPATGTWKISWSNALTGVAMTLSGRREADEIVQRGAEPDGTPARWIFGDITTDSFRWRNEVSDDGGVRWRVKQTFVARRRR